MCYAKRGHNVTVISQVAYEIPGINNIHIPCKWGANKFLIILYVLRLAYTIRRIMPDIVHIHYAGVYELLATYLAGRPYVVTMIGSDILKQLDSKLSSFKKRVMILCLKKASLLNSVSDNITNVVRKYIGARNRIIKVAWGIDHDVFRPLDKPESRRYFNIGLNRFVVLSPRLLKPIYNIDTIVNAVALLPKKIDCLLVLCSYNADAEYKEYLLRLVAAKGLHDQILILNAIDNEVMPYLYNAADVSVMVPDSDGMPVSLLEGMACGVPNIITNNASYDEIVCHNVSAIYVNINEQEIADAILRLHDDDMLSSNIVAAAFERVKKQSNFNDDVVSIENEYYRIAKM